MFAKGPITDHCQLFDYLISAIPRCPLTSQPWPSPLVSWKRSFSEVDTMTLLSRREFSELCVAFGSFAAATALGAASSVASTTAERTVKFRDGTVVSAL